MEIVRALGKVRGMSLFCQALLSTATGHLTDGLLAGAASGLHCVGMCGPMGATFLGGRFTLLAYHSLRVVTCAVLGMTIGAVGAVLGAKDFTGHGYVLSFVLAGFLLLFALGFERFLGTLPGVGRFFRFLLSKSTGLKPWKRAALIGAMTPLLPCGPLYAIYSAAAISGSALQGAWILTGFAIASLPLLALTHAQLSFLHKKLGPRGMLWLQRGTLLIAAAVLFWRGWNNLQGASCCH